MEQHQPTAQVLSLGSINADFQMRVERRPELSETLLGRDFLRLGGGKAANVAFLCNRLGVPARLYGQVGDDDLAEQALAPLRAAGLDLSGVRALSGECTGMSMITVPPDGRKGIVLAANANEVPWPRPELERLRQALREAPAGSVLAADAEIDGTTVLEALRAARAAGLRTLLDPSPAARVGPELLALSDFTVPNASEAKTLTGIECHDAASGAEAARRLREMGAGTACVKLPDGGCVAIDAGQLLHVPALPVDVSDTTGAGDAFAGGLAAALALGHPLALAVRWAVAASQCAVQGYGSQPAYPQRPQLEGLAQRLSVHDHVGGA